MIPSVQFKKCVLFLLPLWLTASSALAQDFTLNILPPDPMEPVVDPLASFIFDGSARPVTAAEVADDPTDLFDGAHAFTLSFSNPDAVDVLAISFDYTGTPYQNDFGVAGHTNPPNPALFTSFPAAAVDSWVSTPDPTSGTTGDAFGEGRFRVFDASVDFLTEFDFATITLNPGESAMIGGSVQFSDDQGERIRNAFRYELSVVPEPSSAILFLVACMGLSLVRIGRRRNQG